MSGYRLLPLLKTGSGEAKEIKIHLVGHGGQSFGQATTTFAV